MQIVAAKYIHNSIVASRAFQCLSHTKVCQRPKALDGVCTCLEHKGIANHGKSTAFILKNKQTNKTQIKSQTKQTRNDN